MYRKILTIFIILLIDLVTGTLNPYPRLRKYNHDSDDDTGEPLYLTPFLKNGDIITARTLSIVKHPDMKNILSYSGYFTVNEQYNSNLFFWYFQAHNSPKTAPVVLWLQGGPGASSLFGLFTENGPFFVSTNTSDSTNKLILEPRKYSWHIDYNLIYIDNPVGTGFSFTDSEDGYAKNEIDVGNNLYEGMKQFYQLFPELRSNEFFISGESYAGKYVPALGHAILKMSKKSTEKPHINLKGLAIGNGLSDPRHQLKYSSYLYQLGLIDLNGEKLMHDLEQRGIKCINQKDFECAFNVFDELINMDQLPSGSVFKNLTGFNMYFNYLKTDDDGSGDVMGEFLQLPSTRKCIHVGNNTFHDTDKENKVEIHLKLDVMDSVTTWVSELLSNYKLLIYNGQLDIIVAYPLTESYLQRLKFSGSDEYKTAKRMIWKVDGEIAGYVKTAGNLTECLVRNAGHMAPADQPKWVLDMILRFTTGKGFPNKV